MNVNNVSPSFSGNYAVLIKKTDQVKINKFTELAEAFIETHKRNSMYRAKVSMVDLPNNPSSTMFVFSLPNFLNNAFNDMVAGAKVKSIDLDRFI